MRVLLALGGNALAGPAGRLRPQDQIRSAGEAMRAVADLVADGCDVVLTHGNGPQVGDLLVKNELAAASVPPDPLDWCVAGTQATLGVVLLDALDDALAARGLRRPVATVVTRMLVDGDDPAFTAPTKPIGRFLGKEEAAVLIGHGQTFKDFGSRGWRRVVASPEPREILDAAAISALVAAGFIVVANGGGGVPSTRAGDGALRGVEAVVDKDLGAALLARTVDADRLVIATDVDSAMLGFGTSSARPLGQVDVARLRRHLDAGEFGTGSMGPKVEAACRFVEHTGRLAVITSLANLLPAVSGRIGTVVQPA